MQVTDEVSKYPALAAHTPFEVEDGAICRFPERSHLHLMDELLCPRLLALATPPIRSLFGLVASNHEQWTEPARASSPQILHNERQWSIDRDLLRHPYLAHLNFRAVAMTWMIGAGAPHRKWHQRRS